MSRLWRWGGECSQERIVWRATWVAGPAGTQARFCAHSRALGVTRRSGPAQSGEWASRPVCAIARECRAAARARPACERSRPRWRTTRAWLTSRSTASSRLEVAAAAGTAGPCATRAATLARQGRTIFVAWRDRTHQLSWRARVGRTDPKNVAQRWERVTGRRREPRLQRLNARRSDA